VAATHETTEQRLAKLEAENAKLRDAVVAASTSRRRFSARAFGSVALVVLGALLAPSALVVVWAKVQLTNTDNFVAMLAPLAEHPEIQALLVDEISTAIDNQLDVAGTTAEVVDGIEALGLPPKAAAALSLLEGTAAAGVTSLIRGVTTNLVESDAFATVWAQSLRVSHAQLVAVLRGDQNAVLGISDTGEVGIALGPVVAAVADRMQANGIAFGALIPEVNATIPIAQVDAIVQARTAYALLDSLSWVLPILSALLIAGGILLARGRRLAGIRAAVAVGILMIGVAIGVAIGRGIFIAVISPYLVAGPAGALFDAILPLVAGWAITIAVVAILAIIALVFAGPSKVAIGFRAWASDTGAGIKRWWADRREPAPAPVE
jgi:hypothetical protein